jgi:hypothetical protein
MQMKVPEPIFSSLHWWHLGEKEGIACSLSNFHSPIFLKYNKSKRLQGAQNLILFRNFIQKKNNWHNHPQPHHMNIIILTATGIGHIVFLGIFASTLLVQISEVAVEEKSEKENVMNGGAHAHHGQHQNHAAMDRQFNEKVVVKTAVKCEDINYGMNPRYEKGQLCGAEKVLEENFPASNWHINALTGEQLQFIRAAISRDLSWLKSKYYEFVSKTLSNGMTVKKEEIEQFKKIYGQFQTDYAKLKKEVENPRQAIINSEENVLFAIFAL